MNQEPEDQTSEVAFTLALFLALAMIAIALVFM